MVGALKFDLTSQSFRRNPHPTLFRMQAVGPLVPVKIPIVGQIHFTTTYDACEQLLKRTDDFSVELSRAGWSRFGVFLKLMPSSLKLLSNNMLQKDDPEHKRLRKLVDQAFRRQEINRLEGQIERISGDLIDGLLNSEGDQNGEYDLVKHVARDLPLAVISEMLGLPTADRPLFHRWMRRISEVSSAWSFFKIVPSINKITDYMRGVIKARRAVPSDDLITALVQVEDEGDKLSEDEIVAMVFLLFAAGHETTTHLISGGTLALLQNEAELQRLRDDPSLQPLAVDELLRFVSPVQMTKPRFALNDCEFEGQKIKRGQMLMALLAAANADPAVFELPDKLNIKRQPNRHLGFGAGPHFCLGAWLARKEMEIYLKVMLERAPNLKLGCAERELRWRKGGGIRALERLPLNF